MPDLARRRRAAPPQDVVFVVDTSGSMERRVASTQAQAALRLCLRHLREGDRFNVIAFDDQLPRLRAGAGAVHPAHARAGRPLGRRRSSADGGTEMLAPLLAAVKPAPDGVVVLLTDGQVGNEDEILDDGAGRARRRRASTRSASAPT